MEITKETKVSDILEKYGDIAEVMELFGIQRAGFYSLRILAAKALTVEVAARIHRAPLDTFLKILQQVVESKSSLDKPNSLLDV